MLLSNLQLRHSLYRSRGKRRAMAFLRDPLAKPEQVAAPRDLRETSLTVQLHLAV